MEVCRSCLTSGKDMIAIDDAFVNGYNLLTSLNIMIFDGLSQYSCQSCVNAVQFYLVFRETAITSEATLQQKLLERIKTEDNGLIDEKNNLDVLPALTVPKLKITRSRHSKRKYNSKIAKSEPNPSPASHLDDNINTTDNGDVKIKLEVNNDDFDTMLEDYLEESFDYEYIDSLVKKEGTNAKDIKPKRSERIKTTKLKKSLKKTPKDTSSSCGICPKTFKELSALNDHLERHKNDTHCQLCKEEFDRWPTLFAHRMKHIDKKQYRCYICSKYCGYITQMEYHYVKMHYDQKPDFPCNQCGRSYETPRKLRKHVWATHAQVGAFVCDYCSKSLNNKSLLRAHMANHMDQKNYVCDTCGFTAKRSCGLKDHIIRKHSPGKVSCKQCRRVFPTRAVYDSHKCTKRKQICPICGIQLPMANRLTRHLLQHNAEGTYKCHRCPAVYRTPGALRVHLDRHDGVRTKQCEYCPRAFYSLSVLIKHRRVHTGEKPYVCKVCQKGFTGNHNLKVHMKVHGEYNLVVKKVKDPDNDIFDMYHNKQKSS